MNKFIDKVLSKLNNLFFDTIGNLYSFSKSFKAFLWIFELISLLFCSYTVYRVMGIVNAVVLLVSLGAIMIISARNEQVLKHGSVFGILVTAFVTYRSIDWIADFSISVYEDSMVLFIASQTAMLTVILYILLIITSVLFGQIVERKTDNIKLQKQLILNLFAILFIVYIVVPSETFFSNMSDFDIRYKYLLFFYVPMVILFSYLVPTFIVNIKWNIGKHVLSLMCGVLTAIYIQYMFLNNLNRLLDGTGVDWAKYKTQIIINVFVWLVIIAIPFLLRGKIKIYDKFVTLIPAILIGIHAFSLVFIIAAGLPKENKLMDAYLSSEEQYAVSKEGNIIIFIIDAVDNDFIEQIYNEDPEKYDELKDFTVYTNTCSVYDSTAPSVMTMVAGAEFHNDLSADEWYHLAWTNDKTTGFYDRMHNAGYKINYYNFYGGNPIEWIGKIDNAVSVENVGISQVDYKRLTANMDKLIGYRVLPYVLKKHIDIENISFSELVDIGDYSFTRTYNKDFMDNMKLYVSDSDQPYYIYQHIRGAHWPCPSGDLIEETKYCLDIAGEYVRQMQELGVYDESTIIFCSDHGRHDTGADVGEDVVFGSTPMFFIKEANIHRDKIEFNNAPIYHEDIIATIMENAGVYSEKNIEDVKTFGTSIYMHHEGEQRERAWYDRMCDSSLGETVVSRYTTFNSSFNCWYEYKYTGDKDELKRVVDQGIVSGKYLIKEFFG
ncbi:MAG: hypothetical protein K6G69_00055 [Lachnospiraceae bacterium]|nr:hypothetical protein [Lachnospiraceae bacterium]